MLEGDQFLSSNLFQTFNVAVLIVFQMFLNGFSDNIFHPVGSTL
jgi:hypothetical protein